MSKLAVDVNSKGIQVLRPGTVQKIAISSTATDATAVTSTVVRIVATASLFYSVEGTATTSSTYLPADAVEYIRVNSGEVISVISDSTGSVFITEMV